MPSSTNLSAPPVWHLDPGPLRPLVDQFTDHLASLGHAALTVQSDGDAARHFSVWLQRSGVAVARIDLNTCLHIPTIAAIDSDRNQPPVPSEASRAFR